MHIPVSDTSLAGNALRHIAWQIRRKTGRVSGEYIPKTLLRPFLPAAPVIVDCGAHDGSDTCETARLWPQATIHAFEPVPSVFEKLMRSTLEYPCIQCHPVALAEADGEVAMHISSGGTDAASSLLMPKEALALNPHIYFRDTCLVPSLTLDSWAAANDCPRVDLLWLDMQGSELAMLKAAPRILAGVRVIHLEVALAEIYENNRFCLKCRAS